jgi:hypothetical protein
MTDRDALDALHAAVEAWVRSDAEASSGVLIGQLIETLEATGRRFHAAVDGTVEAAAPS